MAQLIACERCGHGVYSDEKQCSKCHTPVRPEWVAQQKHEIDLDREVPEGPVLAEPAWSAIWRRTSDALITLIVIAVVTAIVLLVR